MENWLYSSAYFPVIAFLFDLLAESCEGGMSLFAGLPRPVEMIQSGKPEIAKFKQANNVHLFSGAFYLCYQGDHQLA